MLLRDLTRGPLRPLLDSVVLIVVPIYKHRRQRSIGPQVKRIARGRTVLPSSAATRTGRGLNLNRDYVKMEAPETRGAAALLEAWDPDVFLDLHTTNGSYHGYALTYATGLNPNATPARDFARDRLLPAVRERMRRRHGHGTFWYGNFRNQDPDSLAQGWETYDARPRFGTNWMGLRGKIWSLSEGYSNADFRTRVTADLRFRARGAEPSRRAAGGRARGGSRPPSGIRPTRLTVRSVLAQASQQDVVAEITRPAGEGNGGYARRIRTGVYRTIRMAGLRPFRAGAARGVARGLPAAVAVRRSRRAAFGGQGIGVERLRQPWSGTAERFTVDTLVLQELFEGHRPVEVEGHWGRGRRDHGGGRLVPRAHDQPLGVLAAYLLEPASEDGLATWNLLDRELQRTPRIPSCASVAARGGRRRAAQP